MSQNNEEPLVSVIILNYNAGQLLINCVESILKTDYSNYEIILVDNASNDESHKRCFKQFPEINLIENSENLGYCEGNNIGVKNAKGDFIVILNPDTMVSSDWIIKLLDAYKKFGEGLYQPKILSLYEEDIIQSTGNMIHLFGFGFARDKGILDEHLHNEIEQIGYAAGTCLFTSQSVLKKIGPLDPFLFLYHDDLDLGWRAAQLGIRSFYVPTTTIFHAESYNLKWSAKKFFWLERNRKYCILTHYSNDTYKKIFPYLIQVEFLMWIFYISKGFLMAKIKAELDIRKNKKKILQKYSELESKKKISDLELIKTFPDEMFIPKNVSGEFGSRLFNSILSKLSQKAKKKLIQ